MAIHDTSSGLTVVRVQSGLDRRELLEKFDGRSATWVVSDVRSKLAIQRRLLEQNGFASGPSVLASQRSLDAVSEED
jgi:hypothetical protein